MRVFPKLFRSVRQRGPRPRPRPLALEALGDRLLPSVTAVLSGGTLTVTGDAGPNAISLFAQSGLIHVLGDAVDRTFVDTDVFFINVQAGDGSDRVNVASSLPASIISLDVNGGGGATDTLNAHEPIVTLLAQDYTVTSTTISRHLTVPISYRNFEALILDAAGVPGNLQSNIHNMINVESLATPLTINANNGDDVINLCPTGQFLDAIQAPVTVRGGNGRDTLHLFDQNNIYGDTYMVGATSLTRDFFGGVTFDAGLDSIVLHNGGDNSTYHVNSGVNVPLRVEDSGGSDTLDYSAWAAGVTVNLSAGTVTGLAGGVSGVENALGGAGADMLTGDAASNYFVGNGGNDVLSGGGGRDILIGGTGSDQLSGGIGDDILIDGYTAYDANVRALNAIMAEWQRTDLGYAARVDHLMNGGGLNDPTPSEHYRLNLTTVTKDNDADTLTGNDGQDWFFARGLSINGPAWDAVTDRVVVNFPPFSLPERLT